MGLWRKTTAFTEERAHPAPMGTILVASLDGVRSVGAHAARRSGRASSAARAGVRRFMDQRTEVHAVGFREARKLPRRSASGQPALDGQPLRKAAFIRAISSGDSISTGV